MIDLYRLGSHRKLMRVILFVRKELRLTLSPQFHLVLKISTPSPFNFVFRFLIVTVVFSLFELLHVSELLRQLVQLFLFFG